MSDVLFDGPVPPMRTQLIVPRGADLAEVAGKLRMAAACADQITVVLPACVARRLAQVLVRSGGAERFAERGAPGTVFAGSSGGDQGVALVALTGSAVGGSGGEFWRAPGAVPPLLSSELRGEVAKARSWAGRQFAGVIAAVVVATIVIGFWALVFGAASWLLTGDWL